MRSLLVSFLVVGFWTGPGTARADFADHFALRDDIGLHKAPVKGKNKLLILPVEVAGHPKIDMEAARVFFESDHPLAMPSFYKVTSGGAFEYEGKVADPIVFDKCPFPDTFKNCAVKRGDPAALKPGIEMLREVFRRADATIDFKQFDANGPEGKPDGFTDMVGIVTNISFGGIGLPVYYINDGDNLAGGTAGPFILDGVKVSHVAIGSTNMVMLHEFGHILGLTDLYSEDQRYGGLQYSAMGDWGYDFRPPLFDAETRYRLGWAKALVVSGTVRVTLEPASEGGAVYKLGSGAEYFLVENRSPGSKFDRNIKSKGLAVFHVDRRVGPKPEDGEFLSRLLKCVNCDPWHPYIMNVPSNGRFDIQNDKKTVDKDTLFAAGQSLLPDPSGTSVGAAHQVPSTNWFDGKESGLRIENIVAVSESSFEVTLTAPRTTRCAEPCTAGVCPLSECIEPPSQPVPDGGAPPGDPVRGCGCAPNAGSDTGFVAAGLLMVFRLRRSVRQRR